MTTSSSIRTIAYSLPERSIRYVVPEICSIPIEHDMHVSFPSRSTAEGSLAEPVPNDKHRPLGISSLEVAHDLRQSTGLLHGMRAEDPSRPRQSRPHMPTALLMGAMRLRHECDPALSLRDGREPAGLSRSCPIGRQGAPRLPNLGPRRRIRPDLPAIPSTARPSMAASLHHLDPRVSSGRTRPAVNWQESCIACGGKARTGAVQHSRSWQEGYSGPSCEPLPPNACQCDMGSASGWRKGTVAMGTSDSRGFIAASSISRFVSVCGLSKKPTTLGKPSSLDASVA